MYALCYYRVLTVIGVSTECENNSPVSNLMKISSANTDLHAGQAQAKLMGAVNVVFLTKALENTQIVSREIILVRVTTP
jgi:hypothetical protein